MGTTTTLIRGGIVLTGPELMPQQGVAVVIEGERITRIAPEASVTVGKNWRVIDADGHTVSPRHIDAHMHFIGSRSPDPMMWAIESHMHGSGSDALGRPAAM